MRASMLVLWKPLLCFPRHSLLFCSQVPNVVSAPHAFLQAELLRSFSGSSPREGEPGQASDYEVYAVFCGKAASVRWTNTPHTPSREWFSLGWLYTPCFAQPRAHATANKQVWHTFRMPQACMWHATASFMFWLNSFQGNFFKGTYISWEPTASYWSSLGLKHLWIFYPILEVFAWGIKLMPGTMTSVLFRSRIWSVPLKSIWCFQNIHHFKGQKYVSKQC